MISATRDRGFRKLLTWFGIPLCIFMWQSLAGAQQETEGASEGNYNIKQSIEFGGRLTDIKGDANTYDTFVNLHEGPRLLGFTTEMHSLNHAGLAFDNLYFSNFGYGGDPNDVSRLRVSKNRWYDFNLLFRRDQNFWDYSLLANPLNPATPLTSAPAGFSPIIGFSPHSMDTVRHLGNYDLVLLPQSKVRFRLGYAHNTNEGPTLTTIHQGTEQLLFQNFRTTVNTYHLGADFRATKKTNISYDQIWNYFRGDPKATDRNQLFSLSKGQPVDLGVSFNAGANHPCGNTFLGPPPGTVSPTCSAYFNFFRSEQVRTNSPTEQLSAQSNEIKNLDLSGRFSYTGGDANMFGYNQGWAGRESRTGLRNDSFLGSAFGRRVIATADFGATWHITDRLSFLDSFHFGNFHYPMALSSSDCSFFSPNLLTGASVFTPLSPLPVNCAVPADGIAGTPGHGGSSGPDVSMALNSNFLKQDQQTNFAEIEYQISSKFGARAGFRYRHREIDDGSYSSTQELFFPANANRGDCALVGGVLPPGCTANGDGSFTFITPSPTFDTGQILINEYAGVFGVWAQPVKDWRISFDTDLMSADNTFTRISPRQSQEYRVRTRYQAASWMSLEGSVRIWEGRDNISQVNNLQHDRSYG